MDFTFKIETGIKPAAGKILIAEPTMPDPHFKRGVVYLCNHNDEGSYGFVLNKPLDKTLDYFIDTLEIDNIPISLGGPVDTSSLHFLHTKPNLLQGEQTTSDIFFGGDLEQAIQLLNEKIINKHDIKFFVGYAGWGMNQLTEEVTKKSWLVADTNQHNIFNNNSSSLWRDSILKLDKEYHILTTLPIDPSLN